MAELPSRPRPRRSSDARPGTLVESARRVPLGRLPLSRALAAACLLPCALAARTAAAADFEVESTTGVQAYEVAGPWGDTNIERRRLLQTLGLAVYNLQGDSAPGEADYSATVRLRLDADFGMNGHLDGAQRGGETDYSIDGGSRYIPGLREAPLDLMYAYVEGRNVASGWLGFRVGRQYVSDVLGWWSFDGALVRLTTPYYVQLEAYGGLEQRGGLPLSTSRFERQGIWRGSHRGFGDDRTQPGSAADFPSYQEADLAPAFGVALESAGPNYIHGRLTYRRVYNLGTSVTQQFPDPDGGVRTSDESRISQDRLGYAANINKPDLGGIKGGVTYDFYNQLVGSFYGGLEVYAGSRVTLGADVDYFVPTFDADSIWNWFTHDPITTITGRAAVDVTREIDVAAWGGTRMWIAEGNPEEFGAGQCEAVRRPGCVGATSLDPNDGDLRDYARDEKNRATTISTDVLANLAGRYRTRTTSVELRGMLQAGERGRRTGADLSGEKRLSGQRYALGARMSLYDWEDPLRPDRGATSFGYVLGAGYRPGEAADFKIEWEHDMNRLVGQRFRVVGLVNLRVAP
ncbi:hypothetical protein predicted by Glimmer/Critica [Sorangium cellulosum So ce56]|uniref:Uncharacterized protein n=1 Tax=Sorangium cellulosum (strain So ce56) TaxID=448385 RepID=A9GEV9_SORC5|nr:hypothetical protein predicted by Glimmer/Critica [Sorangium cellulosum So ce56]